MSDINLAWNVNAADLTIVANDISQDGSLETSVVISLFSDKRAYESDPLPDGQTDRRGWWGDAVPTIPGDQIGSRLWLLGREKQRADVLNRARDYATDALQWLLDDKVAERVDVTAEFTRPGMIGLLVVIVRPLANAAEFRFPNAWIAQDARR